MAFVSQSPSQMCILPISIKKRLPLLILQSPTFWTLTPSFYSFLQTSQSFLSQSLFVVLYQSYQQIQPTHLLLDLQIHKVYNLSSGLCQQLRKQFYQLIRCYITQIAFLGSDYTFLTTHFPVFMLRFCYDHTTFLGTYLSINQET